MWPTTDNYDILRLVSIPVLFIVSFIAAGFPTAARRVRFLKVPGFLFFVGKHFGTGVILSTAFVHLLSDAFANLSDKRVVGLKNLPGLVTLGSLLVIFLIEYTSTVYVESMASKDQPSDKLPPSPSPSPTPPVSLPADDGHQRHTETSPLLSRQVSERDVYWDVYMHHHDHSHQDGRCVETERMNKMVELLGVFVLQLGIMLHSFVIGMTLAVTAISHLPSLLTAIIFHQLFEGLSLGVRFASLPTSIPRSPSHTSAPSPTSSTTVAPPSRDRSIRYIPILLTFLFGITTPLGILVGLLIKGRIPSLQHDDGSSHIPGGSTFRGTMSAISAGLLIYASCVELLAGDFVNDMDMRKSSRGRQIVALTSLICGSIAMAIIH